MQGWFMAGSQPTEYELGVDQAEPRNGKPSAFMASKAATPTPDGFGTMMQMFTGEEYRGKRMRISSWVKSSGVEGWAGLWMRVDAADSNEPLAFDNMGNRPIRGTSDWQLYEVVLDVATESVAVAFGLLLHGKGKVWLNDFKFEEVSAQTPTTGGKSSSLPARPSNLDFTQE